MVSVGRAEPIAVADSLLSSSSCLPCAPTFELRKMHQSSLPLALEARSLLGRRASPAFRLPHVSAKLIVSRTMERRIDLQTACVLTKARY